MQDIKVYLINKIDYVASDSSKEKLIKWYNEEYGVDVDTVKEISLDEKMWWNKGITNEDEDEDLILRNGRFLKQTPFREVYKNHTLKGYEPFIIATVC